MKGKITSSSGLAGIWCGDRPQRKETKQKANFEMRNKKSKKTCNPGGEKEEQITKSKSDEMNSKEKIRTKT